MSIIQDNLDELRYIKRGNLHEEAKTIGNYYRDIIHSYGIDCNYYKLKSNYPVEFEIYAPHHISGETISLSTKTETISTAHKQNNLIQNAYGIEPDPDFSISAKMITYMEVESDIFNFNKYGLIPNTDVNFYFDSLDFAAAMSPKIGRSREYDLGEKTLSIYSSYEELVKYGLYDSTLNNEEHEKFKVPLLFYSPELSTPISVCIPIGELPVKPTPDPETISVKCEISSDVVAKILFPANEILYKSFNYAISGPTDPDNVCLYAEFKLMCDGRFMNLSNTVDLVKAMLAEGVTTPDKLPKNYLQIKNQTIEHYNLSGEEAEQFVKVGDIFNFYKSMQKFILVGKIWGSMLFTDLRLMSKYREKIVPMVGDVVTIDFPDENNRERYQITECNDKDLSQSGLNPLLHKYIWKCKARRYVNDHELFPEQNNADKQMAEKLDLINSAAHDTGKEIEIYPEEEDYVYGGYQKPEDFKDINAYKPVYDDSKQLIDIIEFGNNSLIQTDGYDLYFSTSRTDAEEQQKRRLDPKHTSGKSIKPDNNIQFLRASKDKLVFVEIDGTVGELAALEKSKPAVDAEVKLLDSLTALTVVGNGAQNINSNGDNFFKFSSSGTILFSDGKSLWCYFKTPEGYAKQELPFQE